MLLRKPNQENIENYQTNKVIFIEFCSSLPIHVTRSSAEIRSFQGLSEIRCVVLLSL